MASASTGGASDFRLHQERVSSRPRVTSNCIASNSGQHRERNSSRRLTTDCIRWRAPAQLIKIRLHTRNRYQDFDRVTHFRPSKPCSTPYLVTKQGRVTELVATSKPPPHCGVIPNTSPRSQPSTKHLKIKAVKETSIQQAVSKHQMGEIKTVMAAALRFEVPHTTLFRPIQGSKPRANIPHWDCGV